MQHRHPPDHNNGWLQLVTAVIELIKKIIDLIG
jgi:hypothetical protein